MFSPAKKRMHATHVRVAHALTYPVIYHFSFIYLWKPATIALVPSTTFCDRRYFPTRRGRAVTCVDTLPFIAAAKQASRHLTYKPRTHFLWMSFCSSNLVIMAWQKSMVTSPLSSNRGPSYPLSTTVILTTKNAEAGGGGDQLNSNPFTVGVPSNP